jgi:hypothetical protein
MARIKLIEITVAIECPEMKKSATFLAVFISFSASSLFGGTIDLGYRSSSTPYERYMSSVKGVLRKVSGRPASASMDSVRKLMRQGRRFRYSFTTPYTANLPSVTATRKAGDCKDKSLWLANRLNDSSVRYVIGKASRRSKMSHAWLYWKDDRGQWWILDCTNRSRPLRADRVSKNSYIPFYSYSKNGAYRHAGLSRFASTKSRRMGSRQVVASQR